MRLVKRVFIILVFIVVIVLAVHKTDEINKRNTYNLRIYSSDNIDWKSAYINEEIYTDKFWEQIVNLYSNDISNEYISFSENLEWKDSIVLPERKADEVVIVSKGSLGLISWKAWIDEDSKKVVLYRYPNRKVEVDISLYESLPRRKAY